MNSNVTHAIPRDKVEKVGKQLEAEYGPQVVLHCYAGYFFLIEKDNKSQMIVDVQHVVEQIAMDIKTGNKTSNGDEQLISFFKGVVHKMPITVRIKMMTLEDEQITIDDKQITIDGEQITIDAFHEYVQNFNKLNPGNEEYMFLYYRGFVKQITLTKFVETGSTCWKSWVDAIDAACALRQETFTDEELMKGEITFWCHHFHYHRSTDDQLACLTNDNFVDFRVNRQACD